jgi:hypothetical protein
MHIQLCGAHFNKLYKDKVVFAKYVKENKDGKRPWESISEEKGFCFA